MRKSRPRKPGLSWQSIWPWLTLVVVAVIFAVGAWFRHHYTDIAEKTDALTHCPKELAAHTILLIDQTSALSPRCTQRLQNLLEDLMTTVEVSEKLSIYSIRDDSDITRAPLFMMCNPGGEANGLYENIIAKKNRFVRDFIDPLKIIRKGVENRPESRASPIIGTVNNVAQNYDFKPAVPRRKLIVFSDMIENSYHCSHYKTSSVVNPHSDGCQPLVALDGVQVTIFYVERDEHAAIQGRTHKQFWMDIFEGAGAKVQLHPVH